MCMVLVAVIADGFRMEPNTPSKSPDSGKPAVMQFEQQLPSWCTGNPGVVAARDASDEQLAACIAKYPHITFLNLNYVSSLVTNNGLSHIGALTQLEWLILSGKQFTNDGVKH